MADEYYPQQGDEVQPQPKGPEDEGQEEQGETDEDMGKTTMVPKDFLDDPKPGDQCTVEVVQCFDEDCEIKYIPHREETSDHEKAFDRYMAERETPEPEA